MENINMAFIDEEAQELKNQGEGGSHVIMGAQASDQVEPLETSDAVQRWAFWSSGKVLDREGKTDNVFEMKPEVDMEQAMPPDAVFLGARGSGITTLGSAIIQVGQALTLPGCRLRYQPNRNSEILRRLALSNPGFFIDPGCTNMPGIFHLQFELSCGVLGSTKRAIKSLDFVFKDGESGSPFPETVIPSWYSDESSWLDVAGTTTLVACLDARNPKTLLWRSYMPEILVQLRRARLSLFGKESFHHLKPMRLLILLTCCDSFLIEAAQDLQKRALPQARWSRFNGNPRTLGNSLDPLLTVREILGVAFLEHIYACMGDRDEMAVGFVSARGVPDVPGRLFPSNDNASSQIWKPFGINWLLDFLIRGRASGSISWVKGEAWMDPDDEVDLER